MKNDEDNGDEVGQEVEYLIVHLMSMRTCFVYNLGSLMQEHQGHFIPIGLRRSGVIAEA